MTKTDRDRAGPREGNVTARCAGGKASITLVWCLAVALLVSSGIAYRLLAAEYRGFMKDPIALPNPLSQFPLALNGWTGQDTPIQESTREYMRTHFADDYFSRHYVNSSTGQWADLYVVYCSSQPGGIVGHNPTKCYPGNGWTLDQTTTSQMAIGSGGTVDCLVHRLHKSSPEYQEVVVLNFYVVNGRISIREKDFSGFKWRQPNIAGDPTRYVAQVQVSSVHESAARALGRDATDAILSFLPNAGGTADSAVNVGRQESKSE